MGSRRRNKNYILVGLCGTASLFVMIVLNGSFVILDNQDLDVVGTKTNQKTHDRKYVQLEVNNVEGPEKLNLPPPQTAAKKNRSQEVDIKSAGGFDSQLKPPNTISNQTKLKVSVEMLDILKEDRKLMRPMPLQLNPGIGDDRTRCPKDQSNLLLIGVLTGPGNFDQRDRIRLSYGSVKNVSAIRLKVVFFIGGLTPENALLYPALKEESDAYGDIVQDLSYIDSYRNLTLKGISFLTWINSHCPHPYLVMKVDDDVLVDPFNLVDFLSANQKELHGKFIGRIIEHAKVVRNPLNKLHVSMAAYPHKEYPTYCGGGVGYFIPPTAIPLILSTVKKIEPFQVEDIYFTGVIREAIKFDYYSVPSTHTMAMPYTSRARVDVLHKQMLTVLETDTLMTIGHVHDERFADIFWEMVTLRQHKKRNP